MVEACRISSGRLQGWLTPECHLQRIVGAYVGSAHGAGQFYSRAVTEARDATAKSANDARDEDVSGPVGFDSAAQRKRDEAQFEIGGISKAQLDESRATADADAARVRELT